MEKLGDVISSHVQGHSDKVLCNVPADKNGLTYRVSEMTRPSTLR